MIILDVNKLGIDFDTIIIRDYFEYSYKIC